MELQRTLKNVPQRTLEPILRFSLVSSHNALDKDIKRTWNFHINKIKKIFFVFLKV